MKIKTHLYLVFVFSVAAIAVFNISSLITKTKSIKYFSHRSGAFAALTFLNDSRAYPYEDILPERYYNSFESEKTVSLLKMNNVRPKWEIMGPYNVPGRMLSLAINPKNTNILYAGSATGGLWRTFNSSTGAYWNRIETGFPVLGVMAIAIDPIDTNVIYIGTGEVYGYKTSVGGYVIRTTRGSYGIGILKSTNSGKSWTKSLDWSFNEQRGIQKIVLNPKNNKVIYAGTSEGTYKSTDSGLTWKEIHASHMVQDIILNPIDTNKIIISCGNLFSKNSGIYYSSNSGSSWTKASFPNFTGKTLIDYFTDNPSIVFASVGDSESGKGLYKSTNFGITWNQVHNINVQDYQGFFAHFVAVHPKDQNQIIHAGVNMYKSNNGGSTLKTISGLHVDHHNFVRDPINPNLIYVANDGGVYRSTNFGESYSNIGNGLVTAQFYNGFSSSVQDSNFAIGGLQDNNSVIYSGTENWKTVIGGDGTWTAINPDNDRNVFGSSQYNRISRSTNRGSSFSSSTSGMTAEAAFVSPYRISSVNPSVLYSGRKIVYKSLDNGITWTATNNGSNIDGNAVLAMDIFYRDDNWVYITTSPTTKRSGVFLTSNGGSTWTNITGSLPDRYYMDIAIDPVEKETAYIVLGGYDTPRIYKTTNRGTNWIDISGNLPNVPALSVVIDPFDRTNIYVGNDLGVYFSYDSGKNWLRLKDGLPEAVMAMDLSISRSNKKLRLATHGNGAYQIPLLSTKKAAINIVAAKEDQQFFTGLKNNFSFELNNTSSSSYNDSLKVSVEIHNFKNELVFSSSKNVVSLPPKSKTSIHFENTFIAKQSGQYKISYIVRFLNKFQDDIVNEKNITIRPIPNKVDFVNNYPNPFNSQTTLEYHLPKDQNVKIVVYDSKGEEIVKLVDDFKKLGYHKIVFNAGRLNLTSGVYFCSLQTDDTSITQKMLLLK